MEELDRCFEVIVILAGAVQELHPHHSELSWMNQPKPDLEAAITWLGEQRDGAQNSYVELITPALRLLNLIDAEQVDPLAIASAGNNLLSMLSWARSQSLPPPPAKTALFTQFLLELIKQQIALQRPLVAT